MDASTIANALVSEGKNDKAIKLLDKVMAGITEHSYYYDYSAYFIAAAYFRAGDKAKAEALSKKVVRNAEDDLEWVASLPDNTRSAMGFDVKQQFSVLQSIASAAHYAGDSTYTNSVINTLKVLQPKLREFLQTGPMQQGGEEEGQ